MHMTDGPLLYHIAVDLASIALLLLVIAHVHRAALQHRDLMHLLSDLRIDVAFMAGRMGLTRRDLAEARQTVQAAADEGKTDVIGAEDWRQASLQSLIEEADRYRGDGEERS